MVDELKNKEDFKQKIYLNVYYFGTNNKDIQILFDMFYLQHNNLEELYEKFISNVNELYEELLKNNRPSKKERNNESRMVFIKDKENEMPKETEENFKEKIKNLTDYCSINNAIKAFLTKMQIQKLKFTFTKLIILSDGISLNMNSNENDTFFEKTKYFGLSTLIILIGNFFFYSRTIVY